MSRSLAMSVSLAGLVGRMAWSTTRWSASRRASAVGSMGDVGDRLHGGRVHRRRGLLGRSAAVDTVGALYEVPAAVARDTTSSKNIQPNSLPFDHWRLISASASSGLTSMDAMRPKQALSPSAATNRAALERA